MHGVSTSPQRACQRKAGASLVVIVHGIRHALRQPVAAVAPAAATCPLLTPTRALRSFTAALIKSQLRDVFACRSLALKGEVLVGLDDGQDDALYEMFSEPSHDLRELCSAQLRQLFAVLSRVSPNHSSSCKACVYARRADSFNTPQIKLQQVACWPSKVHNPGLWAAAGGAQQSSGSGSCSSFEELDDLLILHTPPWEPGSSSGSSIGNGVGCDTEASLCQEEVVLLPSSNMLVLPLAEAGVLVGLLVVELATSSSSSMSVVEAAGAVGEEMDSSTGYGPQQQHQQQSWASAGLPEDALWCLRNAVLPLAKACAMDLRQALAGAQQEAQQRLARSLLDEARGPLKVLGTFGQMLAPRLKAEDGKEPESDMAEGMVLQGQRLADVVQQLEAALRPGAAAAAARSAGRQQLPRQQLLALPWAAGDAFDVNKTIELVEESAGSGEFADAELGMANVALQCTPRGGQLCVTARQSGGGVEVKVLHTGQASPSRLHTTRQGLGAVAAPAVPAPAGLALGPAEPGPLQPGRDVSPGHGLQPRQQQFPVVAGARGRNSSSPLGGRALQELAAPGSTGSRSSSRLVSLDFASQLLQAVGGRLSVAYPEQFMNAISGQLEVGSSIERAEMSLQSATTSRVFDAAGKLCKIMIVPFDGQANAWDFH
eukprot:gene7126-7340_t